MGGTRDQHEPHVLRGPIDRSVLLTIRDVIAAEEPLATARLDDYLNPRTLEVTLDDGLCGADAARIDIQWTTRNDYSFHYTDSQDVDLRWDKHPHGGDSVAATDLEHFHPPPDATNNPADVEDSCITHPSPSLVTRTVLHLWRAAYHAGSFEPLNSDSSDS